MSIILKDTSDSDSESRMFPMNLKLSFGAHLLRSLIIQQWNP